MIWIFNLISILTFLFICKLFIPSLDYLEGMKLTTHNFFGAMFVFVYPHGLFFIFYLIFLEDSPRNLILDNDFETAKKVLEKITKKNFSISNMRKMRDNLIENGENKFFVNEGKGITIIFKDRIRSFTILVSVLYFIYEVLFVGISTVFPSIIKRIVEEKHSISLKDKMNTINNLIISQIIGILIFLLGSLFFEIKFIPKKFGNLTIISFSFIFTILSISYYNNTYLFMSSSIFLLQMSYILLITYSFEIFPKYIKDHAMGFLFSIGSLGSVFSQYIFISIFKMGTMYPIYFFLLLLIIIMVILFFLPKENENNLDSLVFGEDNRKNENKIY